jgi:hypothetical protein
VRCAVELPYVHNVVLVLQYSCLVVVDIKVVGSTEYRHDTREAGRSSLSVHAIPRILGFVSADNRQKIVLFQKGASSGIREEVRATPDVVVNEVFPGLLLSELFQRIRPENVAHEAMSWRFAETVDLR